MVFFCGKWNNSGGNFFGKLGNTQSTNLKRGIYWNLFLLKQSKIIFRRGIIALNRIFKRILMDEIK